MTLRKTARFALMCLGAMAALVLSAAAAEVAHTTDAGLRLRAAASTDSEIYCQLEKNTELEICETLDGWYRVKCADGKEGFVCADYVALGAAEEQPRRGVVVGGVINVRTGAGTEYKKITTLSAGKGVTILGEENGWYQISFDDTVGFICGDYLKETTGLTASSVGETVAASATGYLGVRYAYGGSSPSGFDCSGFTMYLYGLCGYSLPHSATKQYNTVGGYVSKEELLPGDLVFFSDSSHAIGHVGIYIGGGQFIHARNSTGRVTIDALSASYYTKHYVGAKRVA